MGESDDPNVTNEQLMEGWKVALISAITGEAAVAAQVKEAASVKASAIVADELEDSDVEDDIGACVHTMCCAANASTFSPLSLFFFCSSIIIFGFLLLFVLGFSFSFSFSFSLSLSRFLCLV